MKMTIKNKMIRKTRRLTGKNKQTCGILAGLALTISSTILTFSGCDTSNDTVSNADMAAVNAAISTLDYTSITFKGAEDQDTVRSDFTLPLNGERGTTISWASSNTDMLSIDQASAAPGSLKTGEASIVITLTATVSKGSAKQSKSFSITVLANENEPPGAPGGLRISTWAVDSLHLEWEEALPGRVNGETGTITGYTVYYNTSDEFLDLTGLKSAHQYSELDPSTTTQITGLDSGTQYYFAVTASNASGEGPVSPSVETHTDTPDGFVPETPAIIERSAGNEQVELTWTAPAATGWKNGQSIAVSGYNIYKDSNPITDTTGLTAVETNIDPQMRTQLISGLDNGSAYYFAVSALTGEGVESLPGGGDISVTPNENISSIGNVLSLSVEDFAAAADESGQAISVDITATSPSELTYGTDYVISISKAGSSVEALVYNPDTQEIDIADTIGLADAGSYTIRASGMGLYNEAVTDDFELTVSVSNTKLLDTTGFSITDLSHTVTALTGASVTLSIDKAGLTPTSDYSLSISPDANGNIHIDDAGAITIDAGITVNDAGDYTITATGRNDYSGTVSATFTLNVQAVFLSSISYGGQPLAAVYNTAITDLTATVEPADAADKVDFSIDPSLNSDTGLSFDTGSGRISGTPNKLLTQKSYTVTITGKTNTIYEGEAKVVNIQVSVAPKDIADTSFAMTFDDKSDANEGVIASHSAASFDTDGLIATSDYELTIAGPGGAAVDAVTIDNDGNISIGSGIDKDNTGEYTVTAAGRNNYNASIKATFTLTVRRKITGISFTESTLSLMPDQTMPTLTPTLTTGIGTQLDDDNIEYTISPDLHTNTGLTFDTAAGTISGTATTESAVQTYTITVIPDAGHYTSTAAARIDIEVTEALSATYSPIVGTVNTSIALTAAKVNNTGWTGTFSATLPTGLDINTDNGDITGTPTSIAAAAADYAVNLTGTDLYDGVNAAARVSITVNPKAITSVTYAEVDAVATVEIAPSVAPTVVPAGAEVTYALDPSETLPSGLKVNPNSGAIEGTAASGTNQVLTEYTIDVRGTGDWLGSNTQAKVKIRIDTAPDISASYDELIITVRDTVDVRYKSITPGETASFAMPAGESLPEGLTLGQDGRITGTATRITGKTTYHIVLTGTGTNTGRSGTAFVVITVEPKTITSVSYDDISAVYNTAITALTPKTKIPTGLTATYSSSDLPPGLTISDSTAGEISGSPTALQETRASTISITGTGDWAGHSTTATVNITVIPKTLSTVSGFSITGSGTVSALTDSIVQATVNGGLTHTRDYTLSITSAPNSNKHVTIANNAQLTVGSDITIQDAGDYTITATGQNNYDGQVTGTFKLTINPKQLTSALLGSISNPKAELTVTLGLTNDVTRTLSFNNSLTIGSDFTLSLERIPQNATGGRVTLDSNTGVLTISKDVVPADSGTYTLKATGQGNYSGTAAASLEITVNRISISGTFSYADLEISTGQTKRSNSASWNNAEPGQTLRYSLISPPAGISIDEKTGVVTVDAKVLTSSTSCSIRAEGTEDFTGEITAMLKISIRNRIPSDLTLTYTDIRVYKGSSASSSPQWSSGGYTVTYDIAPLSGGTLPVEINIDPSSGVIDVSSSAALQADTLYQVTATATGSWKGWKKAEIRISVYDTFSYEFKLALVGQPFSLTPLNSLSSVQYSASPTLPAGLFLETQTGRIYGTPTKRQLAKEYTITATGGGSAISNKVYLFIRERAANKDDLWRMIDKEIATQGNTADLGLIDTSSITDMSHLFNSYTSNPNSHADYSAFNGNLSEWDVSSVTDMSDMFYKAAAFNGDISEWNVSSVMDMSWMFYGAAAFNGDISEWNVSSVTNMKSMFRGARAFNGDISEWNVSSVTDMEAMFFYVADAFNGDLSKWNVSSVTNMSDMFNRAAAFNRDLTEWNVSSVTDMSTMFRDAKSFNGNLSGWNVSSVTDMQWMFYNAAAFNGDISEWNVSSVTDMSDMFSGAASFNGDLSGWDVSSVTDMQWMFYNARAFNGNLSGWNVSSVTNMYQMFYNAKAFNGDLEAWGAKLGTHVLMTGMFRYSGLANNLPSWY